MGISLNSAFSWVYTGILDSRNLWTSQNRNFYMEKRKNWEKMEKQEFFPTKKAPIKPFPVSLWVKSSL